MICWFTVMCVPKRYEGEIRDFGDVVKINELELSLSNSYTNTSNGCTYHPAVELGAEGIAHRPGASITPSGSMTLNTHRPSPSYCRRHWIRRPGVWRTKWTSISLRFTARRVSQSVETPRPALTLRARTSSSICPWPSRSWTRRIRRSPGGLWFPRGSIRRWCLPRLL
jgi:hypothetical protein